MGTATATASPIGVSWEDVKKWDERYYLRPFRSLEEYTHVAVDHGEGSYLVLSSLSAPPSRCPASSISISRRS